MALNSMYENLMGLPLFNGVSYNRISEIVGGTRLAFLKFLPGEKIVMAGDPCTRLMFVIGGKVRLSIRNSSDRFIVSRTLEAPSVISPDFLFGRNTLFPASVTAIDTVSIMEIEKTTSFPLSAAMKSASSTILTSFQPTPRKPLTELSLLHQDLLKNELPSDHRPHPARCQRHSARLPPARPLLTVRRAALVIHQHPRLHERTRPH